MKLCFSAWREFSGIFALITLPCTLCNRHMSTRLISEGARACVKCVIEAHTLWSTILRPVYRSTLQTAKSTTRVLSCPQVEFVYIHFADSNHDREREYAYERTTCVRTIKLSSIQTLSLLARSLPRFISLSMISTFCAHLMRSSLPSNNRQQQESQIDLLMVLLDRDSKMSRISMKAKRKSRLPSSPSLP